MEAITDAEFDRKVQWSSQPLLVHFHSKMEDRCQEMRATLNRIETGHPDWIRMVSLDIDENPVIANRYRIRQLPVLMLFKGGSVEFTIAGQVPEVRLVSILERYL